MPAPGRLIQQIAGLGIFFRVIIISTVQHECPCSSKADSNNKCGLTDSVPIQNCLRNELLTCIWDVEGDE